MPNIAAIAGPTRDAKFRDLLKKRRAALVLPW